MPQPFQAPTLFNVGGVHGQPESASETPGALPDQKKNNKKEQKEKKEKKPPKAKTVEQEAKAVSWRMVGIEDV